MADGRSSVHLSEGPQEPERIREDFSRILEGISPPVTARSAYGPAAVPLSAPPVSPGHTFAALAPQALPASPYSLPPYPASPTLRAASPRRAPSPQRGVAGAEGQAPPSPGCSPAFAAVRRSASAHTPSTRRLLSAGLTGQQATGAPSWQAQGLPAHAPNILWDFPVGSAIDVKRAPHDGTGPPSGELSIRQIFPEFFSFSCFILFLAPIWVIIHLSHDRDVVYWTGHWCQLALLLPFLFIGAFFVQVRLQRPHRTTVLVSLLLPAAVLLILSDILTSVSADKVDQLLSSDCDTFAAKRELEHSWQAARKLYLGCLQDTVSSQKLTMETAIELFRIQDCTEYAQSQSRYQKDWDYLWYLEDEHACAGWCSFGQRMWTYKQTTDSCSVAVSQVFAEKIKRSGKQVVLYTVIILVVTTFGNIAITPYLRRMGVDW